MKLHHTITPERILALCEQRDRSLDNPGICIRCGEDAEGCEPDGQRLECEACGARAVYGPEMLLMGAQL